MTRKEKGKRPWRVQAIGSKCLNGLRFPGLTRVDVSDVVVFPEPVSSAQVTRQKAGNPPLDERMDLCSDLWVGPLGEDDGLTIIKACEPRELMDEVPEPEERELYTFVREYRAGASPILWDEDNLLRECVGLSRLIHPTSLSFSFSARVFRKDGRQIVRVQSGLKPGLWSSAFIAPDERDWLTEREAAELKDILRAFLRNQPKEPVSRALWYHEYAAQSYFLDARWTLVATGLESLIHTDREKSTAQFKLRLPQLAAAVGAGPVSSREAGEMYDRRSSLAHGQGFPNVAAGKIKAADIALYVKMEGILRTAIRHAILTPSFAKFLSDKKKVRQEWQI